MLCRNWLTKFTAVIQRQSLYFIVRRNPVLPVEIIIMPIRIRYRNAPQHNTNANSRLSWHLQRHLTQTIVAVTSTLHTIISVSLPFRVLTRADCPVSPTNATNTGGQIALWRLIDCKWTLRDINNKPAVNELSGATVGHFDSCHEIR